MSAFEKRKVNLLREGMKQPFKIDTPSKIIIDTHGGIQDIMAIVVAYRLIQHSKTGQQIIGITCVNGKNSVDDAVKSALVANKLLGTKIPVFRGQKETLMLKTIYPQSYMEQKFTHLEQRLYAELEQDKTIFDLVQHEGAVDFLIRACEQHKGNLGIVAFGPLTNLGLAYRLEDCLTKAKVVSVTGGQYLGMGTTKVGHIQPNFAHDPLAAHIVFEIRHKKEYLKNKLYINPIEESISFCFKHVFNRCLEGKLDPAIDDIMVNMMGINSIVLDCAPLLTILPLIQPKVVQKQFHCYGEIIRDADCEISGLLAINWIKDTDFNGKYQSHFYVYNEYNKQKMSDAIFQALNIDKK